jgi:hypothetical protein
MALLRSSMMNCAATVIVSLTGLYDAGVLGGSDLLMTLAWTRKLDRGTVERMLPLKARAHFFKWASASCKWISNSIGYLPIPIFHLWHGEQQNRLYYTRHQSLKDFDFDPDKDIRLNDEGCWEWGTRKPDFHNQVSIYFANRREDG